MVAVTITISRSELLSNGLHALLTKSSFLTQVKTPPDLRIIAGNYTWNVHCKRFCNSSTQFNEECKAATFPNGQPPENYTHPYESHTGQRVVQMDSEKPEHISRMIQWIYGGEYDTIVKMKFPLSTSHETRLWEILKLGLATGSRDSTTSTETADYEENPPSVHKALYSIAIRYQFRERSLHNRGAAPGLKEIAIVKSIKACDDSNAAFWELWQFAKTAAITTHDLKVDLEKFFLGKYARFINDAEIGTILKDDPNFAWSLAKAAGMIDEKGFEKMVKNDPMLALKTAKKDVERAAKRQKV